MHQKGQALILVIVGLLVLVAVAGGAYYFRKVSNRPASSTSQYPSQPSPTPQATSVPSDWKTYQNSQYKISFQYPSDLELEEDALDYDPDFISISLSVPNPNPPSPYSPTPGSAGELLQKKYGVTVNPASRIYYFSVNIYSRSYDKSPRVGISKDDLEKVFLNAQINQTYQNPQKQRKFIRISDQTINGTKFSTFKIQAISDVVIEEEAEQYGESVLALYDGNVYEFPADDKTYFDKILQTVKFGQ